MERNEVSLHEVKVYLVFTADTHHWLTSREVAERAGVAYRTARAHCYKLVGAGLLDQAEVFPGHRYRLSERAKSRNLAYKQRLDHACEVFGLTDSR